MFRYRFLRHRTLSTSSFDPTAWVSSHTFSSPRAIQNLLLDYSKLIPENQLHVQKVSPEPVRRSLQLLTMLQDGSSQVDVFHHIATHVDSRMLSSLVEAYLLLLLASGNLNAVVSLVHVLYRCDSTHYRLSNQFWSHLASLASLLSHNAAATLVYHEIVNPHRVYSKGAALGVNHYVPFLLLPTAIEQLAIVFARNGNVAAVEGLRHYFKRYYSYFGHRNTYQTLSLARVEVLSVTGNLLGALEAYVDLCLKYRGHTIHRDPSAAAHSLKYLAFRGYKDRKRNIMNNLGIGDLKVDLLQEREARAKNIKLFNPRVRYNVYRRQGVPHWSIFDGCVHVGDLPMFFELLRDNTQKLVYEQYSVVDRLMDLISRHHHSLHKFVVVSLCELGYVEEAWAVMSKLPKRYPRIPQNILFSGPEVFTSLFRALRRAYDGKSRADVRCIDNLDDILSLSYRLYRKLHKVPVSCHQSYMSALVASPNATHQEVVSLLKEWNQQKVKVVLDTESQLRLNVLINYVTPRSVAPSVPLIK